DQKIEPTIGIIVNILPLIGPDCLAPRTDQLMHVGGHGKRTWTLKTMLSEIGVFDPRTQHTRFALHEADLKILQPRPDAAPWQKDHVVRARSERLARVLKKIGAVGGLVWARNHQVQVTILVIVHRQG